MGVSLAEANNNVERILDYFHIYRDERGIFDRWCTLVTDDAVVGKTAHVARLIASMLRHGQTRLVTFNFAHFHRFADIVATHPDNVSSVPT